jgi:hypothetical protein
MSFDTLFGVLIGSGIGAGISIIVTYLTHRWTWERERKKTDMELEEEEISQIFSPLVFILQKVRDIFVYFVGLHDTILKIPRTKDKEKDTGMEVPILSFLGARAADKIDSYADALEDLLLHKGGLIKTYEFYLDLVILQSYLSTLVKFVARLISKNDKDIPKLRVYLSTLAPVLIALDEAIGEMRMYALKKTTRRPKPEYKQFFTQKKYSELENHLDEAIKVLNGEGIPEWPLPLKRLLDQNIRKNAEE